MIERLAREEALLGSEGVEKLRSSGVAVFGLGGVGSWCAEALARAGVGRLYLIDGDVVEESNINRQVCALSSTIGRPKAAVMKERLSDISPDAEIAAAEGRYDADSGEKYFSENYDYIADCIDSVSCKTDLICTALSRSIPIISSMGTGNKLDAGLLRTADLSETEGCPLARVMRRELRKRGVEHLDVLYSPEKPVDGRRGVQGSCVWVTATAGFLIAQHIILSLLGPGGR